MPSSLTEYEIPVSPQDVATYVDWMQSLSRPGTILINAGSSTVRVITSEMTDKMMVNIGVVRQGEPPAFTTMPAPLPHPRNTFSIIVPPDPAAARENDKGRRLQVDYTRAMSKSEGWRLVPAIKQQVEMLSVKTGANLGVDFAKSYAETGMAYTARFKEQFGPMHAAASGIGEAARQQVYTLIGLELAKHDAFLQAGTKPQLVGGRGTDSINKADPLYTALRHVTYDTAVFSTAVDTRKRIHSHVGFLESQG